ncbi:MAG: hypothetical protein ACK4VW_06940, partial [Anaerolineales bacterium]
TQGFLRGFYQWPAEAGGHIGKQIGEVPGVGKSLPQCRHSCPETRDRVQVEMSPYDLTRGRIVFRQRRESPLVVEEE